MKRLSFAVSCELCGQDRFYVLRVAGEDAAEAAGCCFDGRAVDEPGLPGFEVFVVDCGLDTAVDKVDVCEDVSISYGGWKGGEWHHREATS